MSQINTWYPATTYLTGFLEAKGYEALQADLSLELALKAFSSSGLSSLKHPHAGSHAGLALSFLQDTRPDLQDAINRRELFIEGPRFEVLSQYPPGVLEQLPPKVRAKHIASLCLDDLADWIKAHVDSDFGLSRYGERLAASISTMDALLGKLEGRNLTQIQTWIEELASQALLKHRPDVVGITVPFAGNLLGALQICRAIKREQPHVKIILGGGYINTELRKLSDKRMFTYCDALVFDAGETPLLAYLEFLQGNRPQALLKRTMIPGCEWIDGAQEFDLGPAHWGVPTTRGLNVNQYISMIEMINPAHRLWSERSWNKLTLAHGCYWKRCTFCDVSLDYIGRYQPTPVKAVIERMKALIAENGIRGFHFVDEAAPPALLRGISEAILKEELEVSWWGNIRFDKAFTPELANLMAKAGCIAVTGGLEVADDRLLKLMDKGISTAQAARVTHAFQSAGIMVHAYLMYGFPTETAQETIDSLERVRQLFKIGCLSSAFWHRLSVTAHSPIGTNPEAFGIELLPYSSTFATNDLPFHDSSGASEIADTLGPGIKKALYNYMHGIGLDLPVMGWFDFRVPKPRVNSDWIIKTLELQQVATSFENRIKY